MLANGAKLEYKEKGAEGEYKELTGLKESPDCGTEQEKVENTALTDKNKQYENGIGDLGDMVYKFRYENTSADSPYRLMRAAQDAGKVLTFKETTKDCTVTEFDAEVSVKRTGGGVNGVIEMELSMAVKSDLTITDPA